MKIFEPIKSKSTGNVIGYFYTYAEDGRLLYISFSSSVYSVRPDAVEPASKEELEATKQHQREIGTRG